MPIHPFAQVEALERAIQIVEALRAQIDALTVQSLSALNPDGGSDTQLLGSDHMRRFVQLVRNSVDPLEELVMLRKKGDLTQAAFDRLRLQLEKQLPDLAHPFFRELVLMSGCIDQIERYLCRPGESPS